MYTNYTLFSEKSFAGPQLWQYRFKLYTLTVMKGRLKWLFSRLTFIKISVLLPHKSLYMTYTGKFNCLFVELKVKFSVSLWQLWICRDDSFILKESYRTFDTVASRLSNGTQRDSRQNLCCRISQQTDVGRRESTEWIKGNKLTSVFGHSERRETRTRSRRPWYVTLASR